MCTRSVSQRGALRELREGGKVRLFLALGQTSMSSRHTHFHRLPRGKSDTTPLHQGRPRDPSVILVTWNASLLFKLPRVKSVAVDGPLPATQAAPSFDGMFGQYMAKGAAPCPPCGMGREIYSLTVQSQWPGSPAPAPTPKAEAPSLL